MVNIWHKVANFLGIGYHDETDSRYTQHQNVWRERRRRLLSKKCGTLSKPQYQYRQQVQEEQSQQLQHQTQPPENYLLQLSTSDQIDFDARKSIVKLVNDILASHEPKRMFGLGLVGKLLKRKFRKDLTYAQLHALLSFNDHRPYFTYWVTTVQILIMIVTLIFYGLAPIGLSQTVIKQKVLVSTLDHEEGSYQEQDNIWIGPRTADLIHLGAKFTPCMRRDENVYQSIELDKEEEKYTGCCIRSDLSGCLQTTQEVCTAIWSSWNYSTTSTSLSSSTSSPPTYIDTFKKSVPRTSGPVCGQDPSYCAQPASIHPHEWPNDISKWPICIKFLPPKAKLLDHMTCELTGRPCCIGIFGQCRITHSEHCQFLRGTFHPEARLCSQVSCMEDVCGMVPFYTRDYPNQFYRLATALFLHAGIIHLTFTVTLQLYVMRDIERLLGSKRIAIIYIVSGIAGYLASATFVPYHTQVGPSGSQFALFACLMAEIINSWDYLEDPLASISKFIFMAIGLFVLGLLPWIDNFAHIFGFITGLALSLALTPYLSPLTEYSRRLKVIQIFVCSIFVILLLVLLTLPLYFYPIYCSWCQYLDCISIPGYPNWCINHDIVVERLDKY